MEKEIIEWIYEAGDKIRKALKEDTLQVDHKSGRTDIVTNVDKDIQNFLVDKIKSFDPKAKILGEENGQDTTSIDQGRVFVIDPIDGTLNFVYQKENFCIMIAVYEEGIGRLGFIYDVMRDDLFWGGPKVNAVYHNEKELKAPKNKTLEEGLLGVGMPVYTNNYHHTKDIGVRTMGVRVLGCAGLDFIAILKGTQIGYLSSLSPWDYAAGKVMMEQIEMPTCGADFQPLNFSGREFFIGLTSAAMNQAKEYKD
ncbi:inositol monophosphatase family protein [Candidatus Enterococcus ferrettii]|uniref:Myo-inositol-1(Or 4)-monophosphatase n=1 Tax=Candidatus Enterococcus ferrettii TaxID=2815324 RepID=A0ABV0ET59_9ENTE|nr:inositol monophosphatase family protein [Enterococcus sp. 665A]MBO1341333.1 inositol monophosphatase family protein [Enterococcus sp. 665A]